jgi:uncharacterized Tic20 family protein
MSDTSEAQTPEPTPESAATEPVSNDDRNLAVITHLSGIILWFLVPLIVWLVSKDQTGKRYLSEEAKEALNFQIAVGIAYIVSWILMSVFIGFILWWIVWALNIVFCVIAAIQVSQQASYRYPITLRLLT